jgi:hypothetical protein
MVWKVLSSYKHLHLAESQNGVGFRPTFTIVNPAQWYTQYFWSVRVGCSTHRRHTGAVLLAVIIARLSQWDVKADVL